MSMHILAFDTSSQITAVAVMRDEHVLSEDSGPATAPALRGSHAQTLLPRVQACLTAAQLQLSDIDLIAVGVGPGSFTGVRVGLATAKGFAIANPKTQVRGVVSLAALARAAFDSHAVPADALVATLLDAHKSEVFASLYARAADGELTQLLEPFHAAPEVAALQLQAALAGRAPHVVGAGHRRYAAQLTALLSDANVLGPELDDPSAVALAREARRAFLREGASDVSTLLPMYLRGSDAQLPKTALRMS